MKPFALVALSAAALAFSPSQAPSTVSVWDGVFTADQAKRGADLYAKSCASCHGDQLEGEGQAPSLTGAEFTGNWNKQVVDDLFEIVKSTMPGDKPGTLSRATNADIMAYIFQTNGFPAGKNELPSDAESLKRIRIEGKK
ncbi:MAG TPA: cytochrome c [Bryobacteraceae bacterium]|jgi:mono/diheme cytochrome c family protein|nr:cytochrome c [Bryobacteraceae bacterium]